MPMAERHATHGRADDMATPDEPQAGETAEHTVAVAEPAEAEA